jgi:hypothetical protein
MTQILISLAILALWALTSLLSREAQPLPPRQTRPRPGEGPRPVSAFTRSDQLAAEAARSGAQRPTPATSDSRFPPRPLDSPLSGRTTAGRSLSSADDIRVYDADLRGPRPLSGPTGAASPSAAAARAGRSSTRRGSKARAGTGSSQPKPADPARQRALTSQVNLSMAKAMGRPYEGLQLEAPLASLSSTLKPLPTRGASGEQDKQLVARGPGMDVETVRAMLASPERLRDVAFLGELLKPPLALRRGGRFR